MSLNVLLVDDEYLVLEGLKRLVPWERLGMTVVSECTDAFTALQKFDEVTIDILVSDIHMPNMTGLELAEQARARNPSLGVVFLSGYENFHYAKKAIELEAGAYILKPIRYPELEKALASCGEERRKRVLSDVLLHNELLERWLEGEAGWDTVVTIMRDRLPLEASSGCLAAVLEIDGAAVHSLDGAAPSVDDEVRGLIRRRFAGRSVVCKSGRHRIAFVLQPEAAERTGEALHAVLDEVRRACGVSATIGVGPSVPSPTGAPESYLLARQALDRKMFKGKGRVIPYEPEGNAGELSQIHAMDELLERLFEAVYTYRLVDVHDRLEQLLGYARKLRDRLSVYPFVLHITGKWAEYLRGKGEDLYRLMKWEYDSLHILQRMETLDEIESWLRRRMYECSERIKTKKGTRKHKTIERIEQYVREHLGRNLTLRETANHFMLSPNYLGAMFKEETGEHFTDYLNRMRMERAKELLDDPALKIYHIADMLGYRNISYFHTQFREQFGMSPGDYRKGKG